VTEDVKLLTYVTGEDSEEAPGTIPLTDLSNSVKSQVRNGGSWTGQLDEDEDEAAE